MSLLYPNSESPHAFVLPSNDAVKNFHNVALEGAATAIYRTAEQELCPIVHGNFLNLTRAMDVRTAQTPFYLDFYEQLKTTILHLEGCRRLQSDQVQFTAQAQPTAVRQLTRCEDSGKRLCTFQTAPRISSPQYGPGVEIGVGLWGGPGRRPPSRRLWHVSGSTMRPLPIARRTQGLRLRPQTRRLPLSGGSS
jgi:hypothetical protein